MFKGSILNKFGNVGAGMIAIADNDDKETNGSNSRYSNKNNSNTSSNKTKNEFSGNNAKQNDDSRLTNSQIVRALIFDTVVDVIVRSDLINYVI